jgi:hypothetical protein
MLFYGAMREDGSSMDRMGLVYAIFGCRSESPGVVAAHACLLCEQASAENMTNKDISFAQTPFAWR